MLESALRHRMLAMLAHELIAADALRFPPILADLGYESGLYDDVSGRVFPFDRKELLKYRPNPDHLPTYSLRTGDRLVPVIEVDFAMSLTWTRAPYQVPVADVLANVITSEIDVPPLVTFRTAQPAYQFLDTVLHLFREAWFEWWLDQEQDVDLMKFGDVIRLAEAYEPHLSDGQFAELAERYDVRAPVCWVLEHADRAFSLQLRKSLGLAGHISEDFLASAPAKHPITCQPKLILSAPAAEGRL